MKKSENKDKYPGYPQYPANEDIYSQGKEESDIDPENPAKLKDEVDPDIDTNNEKSFADDRSGDDLDVPGSELDDAQEATGNEDEENNYYSLGGDNHENLEEDKGD